MDYDQEYNITAGMGIVPERRTEADEDPAQVNSLFQACVSRFLLSLAHPDCQMPRLDLLALLVMRT